MKELTIYVSDELYGKLLLVPRSEQYIVSLIEKDMSEDKTDVPDKLSDMKASLESINSRLTAIESGIVKPDAKAPKTGASPKPGKPDTSSPEYLPDTSSFYRKLAVVN